MDDERLLAIALWMVPGISARMLDRVRAEAGSLLAAAAGGPAALAATLGLSARARAQLEAALPDWRESALRLGRELEKREGRFLLRGDEAYPDFGALADPPEVLSVRGRLHATKRPGTGDAPPAGERPSRVAIVGSRRTDAGALRMARELAAALATVGVSVVSGGALGVDAAAHEGALEAGGHTLAILGSGVLRPEPPRNRRLFSRILAAGGALVSELPPLSRAFPGNFPRRNRLIAAIADAVVVVRAAEGSGSLHTVAAAEKLGLPVFVVPAPERGDAAAGGEALIRSGRARAVPSAAALLEALDFGSKEAPASVTPIERRLLDALGRTGLPLAYVAEQAGMPLGEAAALLSTLCARGLVRAAGAGRFALREG